MRLLEIECAVQPGTDLLDNIVIRKEAVGSSGSHWSRGRPRIRTCTLGHRSDLPRSYFP